MSYPEVTMGQWKLCSKSPALVAGSGVVAIKDKHGVGDFTLDYDELMRFAQEHPEAQYYEMGKMSPVTLAVALNQGKFSKLGELVKTKRTVDFIDETKRMYIEDPQCVGDLLANHYDSIPLDYSLIGAIQ